MGGWFRHIEPKEGEAVPRCCPCTCSSSAAGAPLCGFAGRTKQTEGKAGHAPPHPPTPPPPPPTSSFRRCRPYLRWCGSRPPCANTMSLTTRTVGFLASSRAIAPPGWYRYHRACTQNRGRGGGSGGDAELVYAGESCGRWRSENPGQALALPLKWLPPAPALPQPGVPAGCAAGRPRQCQTR